MKQLTAKLLILALFTFANKLQAQPDTSTVQKLLQYIFQNVDKSQVPTGFLAEYGAPLIPMTTFNGTLTDSNRIDMNLWRTLYFQLQTSYCQTGTNPLPAITTVNTTISQNAGSNAPVPIPLLIAQYNTVRSDAFSSNLLSYNGGANQVNDVPGRGQNPYQANNLFAACPDKKQTVSGIESFICKSNLVWNNTGKTINQVQIDFANGQGFQTITIGTPIGVTYTDTGYKRWTIKITLSDNSVLQCYNDYYVLKAYAAARYSTGSVAQPGWGVVNVNSGAIVRVGYSSKNYTGTLRKPLIVVEGYDVSHIAPDLQYDYTINDFIKAINDEPVGYDFNGQLDDVAGYDLVFVNFNDGADDIVRNAEIVEEVIRRVNANKVNDDRFGNIRQQNVVMGLSMGGLCARYGLAEMTKNSENTETRLLITHDSPHRGANIPLGLQYFIRMLGNFQLFGYNVYDIYSNYNEALGLLNAPATQELLQYSSTGTNSYMANTFLNTTYRSMVTFSPTDPQPAYRFIATSLGSECAHPLFNPGKTFLNFGAGLGAGINARLLFFRIPILSYYLSVQGSAYALPNQGTVAKLAGLTTINQLTLFGFINIFKQLYNGAAYSTGNELAIDGVPGSISPILDIQSLRDLQSLPIFNPIGISLSFPIGTFLGAYFDVWAYNQGFSYDFAFVSVGSALDVSPYNNDVFSEKYVAGINATYPSSSATFIAQETTNTSPQTTNNVHIRFTARNSRWMYDEMENIVNTENCSNECSPNANFTISGDNSFCNTSNNYTIPNLPSGATVTWDVAPAYATVNTPNAQQTTLTKQANGIATLTATISNSCGGNNIVLNKSNIVVGTGSNTITGTYNSPDNSAETMLPTPPPPPPPPKRFLVPVINPACLVFGTNVSVPAGSTVTWNITVDPGVFWGQGGNNIWCDFTALNQVVYFTATVTNSCGSYDVIYVFQCTTLNTCGIQPQFVYQPETESRSVTLLPNPANNTVTITSANTGTTETTTITASKNSPASKTTALATKTIIKQVKIFDVSGTLMKQINYSTPQQQVNIDVAALQTGIYFVIISDGKNLSYKKMFIQR